jgi:glucan phosphoethanolaminetransferase (alkaline phosphatase superfamily)
MSRVYLVNGKHPVHRALVWFLSSASISFAFFMAVSLTFVIITGSVEGNLLDGLPLFISIPIVIWGVYTGIGISCLLWAMWIYWARFEKGSASVKAGWFLILLFGMQFGALFYAIYLWTTGRIKSATSHEILSSAQ